MKDSVEVAKVAKMAKTIYSVKGKIMNIKQARWSTQTYQISTSNSANENWGHTVHVETEKTVAR